MNPNMFPVTDYSNWLTALKQRIQSAQQRASLSVNRELVLLYWQIGRDILDRQQAQGWGAKVIDQLARDLTAASPDMKGFSRRNLLSMRSFAEAWSELEFVQEVLALWQQAVAKLRNTPWLGTRSLNYGKFGDLLAEVKAVTGGASDD